MPLLIAGNSNQGAQIGIGIKPKTDFIAKIGSFDTDLIQSK